MNEPFDPEALEPPDHKVASGEPVSAPAAPHEADRAPEPGDAAWKRKLRHRGQEWASTAPRPVQKTRAKTTRRKKQAEQEAQPATEPLADVETPRRIRFGFRGWSADEAPSPPGPRRELFRDSSVLLMVIALLILVAGRAEPNVAADVDGDLGAVATNGTLPAGTLDLLHPTEEPSLGPDDTARPTFTVDRATPPPWWFATPTPKPTPKPTKGPGATPAPTPSCDPLATPDPAVPSPTPCPEPTPQPTCDPILDPLCPTPVPTDTSPPVTPTPAPTDSPAPTSSGSANETPTTGSTL